MRISDWSSDVCSSDLTPQPLSFRLPAAELAAIVALGKPSVVVGDRPAAEGVPVTSVDKIAAAGNDGADLPDAVAAVAKAPTSGGSTGRSEEHTSELQSLMRISYAVLCLKTTKLKTITMTRTILDINKHYTRKY